MALARSQRYDLLASLFDYPRRGDYGALLARTIEALAEDGYPAALDSLRVLHGQISTMTLEQVQELYTRTFDINPVCTLEVGWHIYGEDYARGALLIKIRERLREANLVESRELPDHLTHVLALLGRLTGEAADELAARYVLPALNKMLAGADRTDHRYLALLDAVRVVVQTDHDVQPIAPREKRRDPPDWKNRLPMFGDRRCGMGGKPNG